MNSIDLSIQNDDGSFFIANPIYIMTPINTDHDLFDVILAHLSCIRDDPGNDMKFGVETLLDNEDVALFNGEHFYTIITNITFSILEKLPTTSDLSNVVELLHNEFLERFQSQPTELSVDAICRSMLSGNYFDYSTKHTVTINNVTILASIKVDAYQLKYVSR